LGFTETKLNPRPNFSKAIFEIMTKLLTLALKVVFLLGFCVAKSSAKPRKDDDGDDDETVRLIFKYNSDHCKSDVARLIGGNLDVDIPYRHIASVTANRRIWRQIEDLPCVLSVDVDYEVSIDEVPNLRGGGGQERHRELVETKPYGIVMVQADKITLPNPTNGGEPIKVCVVDTGYDLGHEDLPFANVDGNSPYGNGEEWDEDGNSHGTHVAGIIGAIGFNEIGVDSVLSDASRFQFFIGKGLKNSGSGTNSGVLAAIDACVNNGAKVVNLSWGSYDNDATTEQAYKEWFDEGVLFIAAAGNSGNADQHYPAAYKHVMAVASVDEDENKSYFQPLTAKWKSPLRGGIYIPLTQVIAMTINRAPVWLRLMWRLWLPWYGRIFPTAQTTRFEMSL
jgi:subtilisin family serine protease